MAASAAGDDYDVRLDPTCAYCKEHSGVSEIFDGSFHECDNCGKTLAAVAFDDVMLMTKTRQPRKARKAVS